MKNIIIGVCSGIACYKVVALVKRLKKKYNVEVILTEHASKLIDKREFNVKVHTDLFIKGWNYKDYLKKRKIRHTSLADKADLIVIVPATANIIGKLAYGIADDLLTTTVLATQADILICPAMNVKMWQNNIVKKNVEKLRKQYYFVDPCKGKLACGYKGIGRLAPINIIEKEIGSLLKKRNALKGKRILVTAGATSEEIDPVRIITNKSSGKMGIYIAEEARKQGAKVTLIRGKTDIEPCFGINDVKVKTVKDMLNAVKKHTIKNDVVIHAAAVSDFSVKTSKGKIKSDNKVHLELEPTTKILDRIKKFNSKVFLIGFKAEYKVGKKKLINAAYKKLKQSNAELIVANDISKDVFGSEKNDVFNIDKEKRIKHIKGSKKMIAGKILEML